MENMHIAFSPPDITEEEIAEVVDTLRSGWITTGPKTKLFEKKLAEYMETNRVVCLNSATACLEMTLRLLGIGPGDDPYCRGRLPGGGGQVPVPEAEQFPHRVCAGPYAGEHHLCPQYQEISAGGTV